MSRRRWIRAGLAAALLLPGPAFVAGGPAAADEVTATVTVGANPFSATASPDGAHVYVPNSEAGTVSVIATGTDTVTATVPVGDGPTAVAFTPNGARAYVTIADANAVAVLDTATNAVTTTIPVGTSPRGVAVTPDGSRAYVTNYSSGTVSVIATASNTVTGTIANIGGPVGVAIPPDGTHAYVASFDTNVVAVIATASDTVAATIPVGTAPYGVAFSPDGSRAYVTNNGVDSVAVIDTASGTVGTTVTVGLHPSGVAVTPDGTRAYVSVIRPNTLVAIDATTNAVATTTSVGRQPFGVALTPDGTRAYTANYADGTASVVAIDRAPAVGSVTVDGIVAVGSELTAAATGVTGFPVPSVSYAWASSESATGPFTPIPTATAATYTVGGGDAGRWLQVTATATNANGTATATSTAVGPVLSLTRVTPARGLTSGGTRVTLTGTGFVDGDDVLFDTESATDVEVVSGTTIKATTPRRYRGPVDVVVVNPDGGNIIKAEGFEYLSRQRPQRPLRLPASLHDTGWTRLLRVPVTTNAGQRAAIAVSFRPTVAGIAPAGDVPLGRVRTFRHHLWVWLSGARPTTVRVLLSAAPSPGFTRYVATTVYRTD